MGNEVTEDAQARPHSSSIKAHRLMCMEIMKFVNRISQILPSIESARPCSSGIEVLCSLNSAMDKAKLLLQHCTESSKLYLAITGKSMVARCEKVCNALELNLVQIQNMVPLLLAAEISGIIDDLRNSKFIMESAEEEAGKVLLGLITQDASASDSRGTSEFKAFQIAATKLRLTSPKALLIEKRSINQLLDKIRDTDQKKESVVKYLLSLLRKYGKSIGDEQTENSSVQSENPLSGQYTACSTAVYDQCIELERRVGFGCGPSQNDVSHAPALPEEFKCPISLRVMHDPVVIASGQTFERVWIEKWLNEGHDVCPKTKKKLSHLSITPNSALKDLISMWCREQGVSIPGPCSQSRSDLYLGKTLSSNSILNFGNSLNDVPIQNIDVSFVSLASSDTSYISDSSQVKVTDGLNLVSSQMNDNYHRWKSSDDFRHEMNSGSFSKLCELPWESQCKAVEDVKTHLEENSEACFLSNGFVVSLIRFLKHARDIYDVKAQKDGALTLLALVNNSRSELPSLHEDLFHVLASFLDSEITKEALSIIEVLSCHRYCKSKIAASGALLSIVKTLDSETRELQTSSLKILSQLSSNKDIIPNILSLGSIQKLIPLLGDGLFAGHCIEILENLCSIEEGRVAVVQANGCIASIAELLEMGTIEEQEHAVAILLNLCSQRVDCCQMIMEEGVIPSLVNVSINGTYKGKMSATELLRILKDISPSDPPESSLPDTGSNPEFSQNSEKQSKEKKSSSKASRFFGRKMTIFSKPRSLALF